MANFNRVPCSVFIVEKLESFITKEYKPKDGPLKPSRTYHRYVVTIPTMRLSFVLRNTKELNVDPKNAQTIMLNPEILGELYGV
jgi:hypothetical protein